MTEMLVRVFDRLNTVIGEIEPQIDEVTWLRNQYGQAVLRLATTDSKFSEEFAQIGNRVLIEFDNGLPPFGGVIELPRRWGLGEVTLTVYSGEYLLKLRRTDRGRYFSNTPVGTIAQKLVEEANAIRATGLMIGSVWPGGDAHGPEYHFKGLYDIFTQSLFGRLSTAEFTVVPSYANGKIVFTLNVYERRGESKPGVVLHEGMNVNDATSLEEQGPIYNDIVAVGDGEGWGDARPVAPAVDQASVDTYGLREAALIASGVTNLTTLQATANTELANSTQPHSLFTIVAADKPPGQFAEYDVGDSVLAELASLRFDGFKGMVRVNGRTFLPDAGVCPLVVREE